MRISSGRCQLVFELGCLLDYSVDVCKFVINSKFINLDILSVGSRNHLKVGASITYLGAALVARRGPSLHFSEAQILSLRKISMVFEQVLNIVRAE